MIAALYVLPDGPYSGLPDVEVWDEKRDARLYAGPWPVVAHPPCARWGSFWSGGPLLVKQGRPKRLGDDGGCFASAIASVQRWGGVLEHPANSRAWVAFGLPRPPRGGGWIRSLCGGWATHVEQGAYGHLSRKATWLYCVRTHRPILMWGPASGSFVVITNLSSRVGTCAAERRRAIRTGITQRLSHRQRALTPIPFRDLLLSLARSVPQPAGVTP